MSVVWIVLGVVAAFVVVMALVGIFGQSGRALTRLAGLSPTNVADAKTGEQVKIHGRATRIEGESLTARIGSEPVIVSDIHLSYIMSGDTHSVWDNRRAGFVVTDETGSAIVRCADIAIRFSDASLREERGDGGAVVGWVRKAIEEDGVVFHGEPGCRVHIREEVIRQGEAVSVFGVARPAPEGSPHTLMIEAHPELGMALSNRKQYL